MVCWLRAQRGVCTNDLHLRRRVYKIQSRCRVTARPRRSNWLDSVLPARASDVDRMDVDLCFPQGIAISPSGMSQPVALGHSKSRNTVRLATPIGCRKGTVPADGSLHT